MMNVLACRFTKDYSKGLFFIFCVASIWTGASVLTQYIYTGGEFRSPFLLTYIGVSLFVFWLPIHECMKAFLDDDEKKQQQQSQHQHHEASTQQQVPTSAFRDAKHLTHQPHCGNMSPFNHHDDEDGPTFEENANNTNVLQTIEKKGHQRDEVVEENHEGGGINPTPTTITGGSRTDDDDLNVGTFWTHREHFFVAFQICPVWFIANWMYNAGLAYTSITSCTILASTSSLFTFAFAVITRDERFSLVRFLGVMLGVTGSIVTAWSDTPNNENDSDNDDSDGNDRRLWGDLMGLIGAIGYGAYSVQTRNLCPKDERLYSMQLILGYIGLICLVALSPMAIYAIWEMEFSSEATGGLTMMMVGFLITKGFMDNFVSEYLWLRAVMLTNATVAAVGLSGLSIPLAFVCDVVFGFDIDGDNKNDDSGDDSSSMPSSRATDVLEWDEILGAILVFLGFILVNTDGDACDGDDVGEVDDSAEEDPNTIYAQEEHQQVYHRIFE